MCDPKISDSTVVDGSRSRTSSWEKQLPWGGGQALSGDADRSHTWALGPSLTTVGLEVKRKACDKVESDAEEE